MNFYLPDKHLMENVDLSVENGREKYNYYSQVAEQALSKFKLRPIKDHYRGTFENFDIEKQKVREW